VKGKALEVPAYEVLKAKSGPDSSSPSVAEGA
jgi:hypothetical protein